MSAVYRVRQFVRAASARVRPRDVQEIAAYLSPAAVDLFEAMPRYDQQHALRVMRTLQQLGHSDPDLLAAALLHDVGKAAQKMGSLRLWHRVAVVLMRAFRPGMLEKLGRESAAGWRRPFYVQQHHAALSADLALGAGCSQRTVELIRGHEDRSDRIDDPLLAALQTADNEN